MRKRKLIIIHFQPLERFPPVMNLLDFLSAKNDKNIVTITTKNKKESLLQEYTNTSIRIIRTPAIVPKSFFRLFNYLRFYGYSLWLLIRLKPSVVLYFETLSSWPALIYKRLRKNNLNLLLHCHEYTSPKDYNDMWLVRMMHRMETKMYPTSYKWISHTNQVRMEQFKKDHDLPNVNPGIFHIMPNYPPKSWANYQSDFMLSDKIRLVFVGSLGFENMYLKEIVNWITLNKDRISLDFYSYNIDQKAQKFLNSVPHDSIQFHEGCSYNELPSVLKKYDVGLVLYKAYNFNHINGISNKVYEYLACGLDVWFPKDNTYMLSIVRENEFPKIIALDFKNLVSFDYKNSVERNCLDKSSNNYFAENIYEEISNEINVLIK